MSGNEASAIGSPARDQQRRSSAFVGESAAVRSLQLPWRRLVGSADDAGARPQQRTAFLRPPTSSTRAATCVHALGGYRVHRPGTAGPARAATCTGAIALRLSGDGGPAVTGSTGSRFFGTNATVCIFEDQASFTGKCRRPAPRARHGCKCRVGWSDRLVTGHRARAASTEPDRQLRQHG